MDFMAGPQHSWYFWLQEEGTVHKCTSNQQNNGMDQVGLKVADLNTAREANGGTVAVTQTAGL